jgi:type IV pilus assembly protein PilV
LGFSLIEALIAMFVFSIALLGIAAMYSRALGVSHSAYLRTIASLQAMDLAERIRANPEAAAGEYDFVCPVNTAHDCEAGSCSPDDLAEWDQAQWCADTQNLFGAGLFDSARSDTDGDDYLISIVWKERQIGNNNTQSLSETQDADGNALFTWRVRQ